MGNGFKHGPLGVQGAEPRRRMRPGGWKWGGVSRRNRQASQNASRLDVYRTLTFCRKRLIFNGKAMHLMVWGEARCPRIRHWSDLRVLPTSDILSEHRRLGSSKGPGISVTEAITRLKATSRMALSGRNRQAK